MERIVSTFINSDSIIGKHENFIGLFSSWTKIKIL